jgi:hypothetical protein
MIRRLLFDERSHHIACMARQMGNSHYITPALTVSAMSTGPFLPRATLQLPKHTCAAGQGRLCAAEVAHRACGFERSGAPGKRHGPRYVEKRPVLLGARSRGHRLAAGRLALVTAARNEACLIVYRAAWSLQIRKCNMLEMMTTPVYFNCVKKCTNKLTGPRVTIYRDNRTSEGGRTYRVWALLRTIRLVNCEVRPYSEVSRFFFSSKNVCK